MLAEMAADEAGAAGDRDPRRPSPVSPRRPGGTPVRVPPEALAVRPADMPPDEALDPLRGAKEGCHLRSVAGDRGDPYRDVLGREGLREGLPGAPGDARPAQREELPDDVGKLLVVEQRGAEGALGGGAHDAVVDMSADSERGDDPGASAPAGERGEALREGGDQPLFLRRDRAEESLESGIERLSRSADRGDGSPPGAPNGAPRAASARQAARSSRRRVAMTSPGCELPEVVDPGDQGRGRR